MSYITVGDQGFISADRVLSVGRADSAPMRRLLAALPRDKVITLTGGRRRMSVVLLDTGHAVITALQVADLQAQLQLLERGAPRDGTDG